MRPRQSITDIFSTFIQFEADNFAGWVADARLRRNMQQSLAQLSDSKSSERFWAIYWHKRWQAQPDRVITSHLSAHLQEACYWSVQRVIQRLDSSQYKLSDCFQVAIAEVPKILKACDPDQSTSLKTYASSAFSNIIRDYLRQRREVDRCSDWGLLLKLSRKQFTESLENAGFNQETCDRYRLAWQCFQETYVPTKAPGLRQMQPPDRATWEAIAQQYNTQRQKLPVPGTDTSPESLEKWLISCANQARAYLYPTVSSLNMPKTGQSGEMQDDLPDTSQDSLLTELIASEEVQERQTQQTQINTVLEDALKTLDPNALELMQLYYQQKLTQQQIAQQLGLQQYKISRKLARGREHLLLALTRWSQETLHISPTSTVVKYISTVLEEWLQAHYQAPDFHSV